MAAEQKRIVVSEDYGFGRLIFQKKMPAIGVVLIARGTIRGDMIKASTEVSFRIFNMADALPGNFTIVEASRTRHRPLKEE